jgi:hypothetical protein
MQRRDFLKRGMTITVLAAASPHLLTGTTETAASSGLTTSFVTSSGHHAAFFRGERVLVDYCTARSLKTPHLLHILGPSAGQRLVPGERLPMADP